MTPAEAIKKIRDYPSGSYLRCPFCGCKSSGTHGSYGKECVVTVLEAMLTVAPQSDWEQKFKDHTVAVGLFLNELYAIMVDPCAEGTRTVQETKDELIKAALRDREPAASPQQEPSGDRLVTLNISIGRDGKAISDLQTHDNSYAEVATGLGAIRDEIERVFAESKNCPYHPKDRAAANTKIIRVAPQRDTVPTEERRSGMVSVPRQWDSEMAHAGYEVHKDANIQCGECGAIYTAMIENWEKRQ